MPKIRICPIGSNNTSRIVKLCRVLGLACFGMKTPVVGVYRLAMKTDSGYFRASSVSGACAA